FGDDLRHLHQLGGKSLAGRRVCSCPLRRNTLQPATLGEIALAFRSKVEAHEFAPPGLGGSSLKLAHAAFHVRHPLCNGFTEGVGLGFEVDVEGAGGDARFPGETIDAKTSKASLAKTTCRRIEN